MKTYSEISKEISRSNKLSRRAMIQLSLGAAGSLGSVAAFGQAGGSILGTSLNVRDYGARGDGSTVDTAAIQKAIDTAAKAGGGEVFFPAGTYLSFSIQLKSHVTLEFGAGSILRGGTPTSAESGYAPAEPQPAAIVPFQDYGHNHWHNSLLWGEGIEDVALIGPGLLDGRGLQKSDGPTFEETPGAGNKAIALKNCRNILLRDLKILNAGHFGILATGVDGLMIDNLLIDTNRDGMDIDCCRNVHVSNCTVNSPWDDAIVIKSSYSLGELRACEQITITGCTVSGCYVPGSVLDGTFLPFTTGFEHDPPSYVGRIKIGTETNGDVRNIAISNCVFQGCMGFTLDCVDGAHVEDVVISNVTMRDCFAAPIFLRLGNRLRGPAGTPMGALRRISFDGINSWNARAKVCAVIAGLPGYSIEDVTLRNLRFHHAPGGALRLGEIPERGSDYPDVQMFGMTPAQGLYVRHAKGLLVSDMTVSSDEADPRPVLVLDDVQDGELRAIRLSEPSLKRPGPFAVGRKLKAVRITAEDGGQVPISDYAP